MQIGDYPTPAQITVSIGDVWLDDALRVEFREESPKIPIFGYDERRPSVFADGRSYVSGSIVINYRFPGYILWAARYKHTRRAKIQEAVELITRIREATVEERIRLLDEARQQGIEDEIADILEKSVTGYDEGKSIPNILENPASEGFQVRIWFDTPEHSLYYRSINGVRFTGRSLAVNNSVNAGADMSASGMPILEVYTFVASEVTDIKSNPIQPDAGDDNNTLHQIPTNPAQVIP